MVHHTPTAGFTTQHGGQQQRQQKQDVVEARPDVPDAFPIEFEKLSPACPALQHERRFVRAEHRGSFSANAAQSKQAAMKRVEVEERGIGDLQARGKRRSVQGETQDGVGAIGEIIHEQFGDIPRPDGAVRPWNVTELLVDNFPDGAYAVLRFALDGPALPTSLEVTYSAFFDIDALHRGLFRLRGVGRERTAVFSPDKPTFVLKSRTRWGQFLEFNREGIWHIWSGFDHILFLLALLLPAVLRREAGGWSVVDHFRPALINVLKIVTAFTLAHSITLTLATLGVVRLPSRLVESTIAASVVVAALNNIRP